MKLKFNVTGMTCAACSARVEKVTNAVSGVEKAEVNLLAGTMQVEAENGNVVPAIIKAVQDAGYNAALPGEKKTDKAEIFALLKDHIDEALMELSDFKTTFGERGNSNEKSDG